MSLISSLQNNNNLPVVAFTFSRNRCDDNANSLSTTDLLPNAHDKSQVHIFFQKSVSRLRGSDSKLPQVSSILLYIFLVYYVIVHSDNLDARSSQAWSCCASQWNPSHTEGGQLWSSSSESLSNFSPDKIYCQSEGEKVMPSPPPLPPY